MNQPFFSILIPCYNVKDYIETAIQSCFNQEFQDFEIIVADNGSIDGTQEILQNINQDKLTSFLGKKYVNDIDLRNFLIRMSKGKYIIWLDPYDKITPFFLEKAYDVLCHQHYDILEFSLIWSHEDGSFDVSSVNDFEYINDNCLELYLNRVDILQDVFKGKVFCSQLMKKINVNVFENIYEYAECFYSMELYFHAKSYKSFSEVFVYDYLDYINRNNFLEKNSLENVINVCKIRNEQLNRSLQILKENNLYNKYALHVLNKLYLYNLFQDMLRLQDIEDRKNAFKEFYKYFTLQLSANILLEDNNEGD